MRRRRRNLVDDGLPVYRQEDVFDLAEPPASDQDIIFNKIVRSDTFVNPTRVPSNEWLLHLSRKRFDRFTQGRHLDQLEVETALGMSGIGASPAMCDSADRPFLVQFAWSTRDVVYAPYAYTANDDSGPRRTVGSWMLVEGGPWQPAILFRTRTGVRSYHGAEKWQVVFRSCSEMDVIPIEARHGGYRTQTGELFTRLADLVDWANTRSSGPPMKWDLPVPGRFETLDEVDRWLNGHVDTRRRRSTERFVVERAIESSSSEAEAVRKINESMRI